MRMRQVSPTSRARQAGFTILELLISVIIIGILVSVVVPVYVTRAAEARLRAAQQDLEALTTAEQHAAIDTGHFYRLYALDDVAGGDGIPPSSPTTDITDGVKDEASRTDVNQPRWLFIDTVNGQLKTNGNDLYDRMTKNETDFNWHGPYVNIARKAPAYTPTVQPYPAGMPLDPWGNPYLLFTKQGLFDEAEKAGVFVTTFRGADGAAYVANRFDRPTLLSLGPDGLPGSAGTPNFGQGDDIMRQF